MAHRQEEFDSDSPETRAKRRAAIKEEVDREIGSIKESLDRLQKAASYLVEDSE